MCLKDTVLANKSMDDLKDPLWVNCIFKTCKEMVIPDELATGRGDRARGCPHLTLERECEVVGVAEVEVTGEIQVLKHLQVSGEMSMNHSCVELGAV